METETERIADFREGKHEDIVTAFNDLLLDLKLQMLGHEPHEPITMERLDKLGTLLRTLEQCTRPSIYR